MRTLAWMHYLSRAAFMRFERQQWTCSGRRLWQSKEIELTRLCLGPVLKGMKRLAAKPSSVLAAAGSVGAVDEADGIGMPFELTNSAPGTAHLSCGAPMSTVKG